MMLNVDPSTPIASDAEIRAAVDTLKAFEANGAAAGKDNASLWRARQLKESAVHPDTGEIVPGPFRMAGYVPFNGPVSWP